MWASSAAWTDDSFACAAATPPLVFSICAASELICDCSEAAVDLFALIWVCRSAELEAIDDSAEEGGNRG